MILSLKQVPRPLTLSLVRLTRVLPLDLESNLWVTMTPPSQLVSTQITSLVLMAFKAVAESAVTAISLLINRIYMLSTLYVWTKPSLQHLLLLAPLQLHPSQQLLLLLTMFQQMQSHQFSLTTVVLVSQEQTWVLTLLVCQAKLSLGSLLETTVLMSWLSMELAY